MQTKLWQQNIFHLLRNMLQGILTDYEHQLSKARSATANPSRPRRITLLHLFMIVNSQCFPLKNALVKY